MAAKEVTKGYWVLDEEHSFDWSKARTDEQVVTLLVLLKGLCLGSVPLFSVSEGKGGAPNLSNIHLSPLHLPGSVRADKAWYLKVQKRVKKLLLGKNRQVRGNVSYLITHARTHTPRIPAGGEAMRVIDYLRTAGAAESNWKPAGTKTIKGVNGKAQFAGTASLWLWQGEAPKGQKAPHYGAVVTITSYEDTKSELWASCTGCIGSAVKKAFRIQALLGGAKADYTDWGKPIGKPADSKGWKKGKGSIVLF